MPPILWPHNMTKTKLPTTRIYTPWTEAEVLSHLTTGWGEGAITEFNLEYLYGPEPEVSGE